MGERKNASSPLSCSPQNIFYEFDASSMSKRHGDTRVPDSYVIDNHMALALLGMRAMGFAGEVVLVYPLVDVAEHQGQE